MVLTSSERTARMRERRRAQAKQMLGGKCIVCGTDEELEFDHIDTATKKFTVADNWSRAWSVLIDEIAKCQLLCREHHIAKTQDAGDGTAVSHGGGKTGKKNCKCEPCAQTKRDYMREFMRELRRERKLAGAVEPKVT